MPTAAEMSISAIGACACGLRRVWPQSIPAAKRSLEYANSPVTFGIASARLTLSPMRPRSSVRGAVVIRGVSSGLTPGHGLVGPDQGSGTRSRLAWTRQSRARGEPHGVEDLRVAGAAAEVAREGLADLVLVRGRIALEQVGRRDDESRGAE